MIRVGSWRKPVNLLLLMMMVGVGLISCGDREGSSSGPHVTPEEQRQLPTEEHNAAAELCPDDVRDPEERAAVRRRGLRHLDALVTSFRRNPDATVETTYGTDSSLLDAGGDKTERLTMTELAAQWLRDLRYSRCAPNVQRQLRALPGVQQRSKRPVPDYG